MTQAKKAFKSKPLDLQLAIQIHLTDSIIVMCTLEEHSSCLILSLSKTDLAHVKGGIPALRKQKCKRILNKIRKQIWGYGVVPPSPPPPFCST